MMAALIADVVDGSVTPQICNAAANAGSNLLKVVTMQHRLGVVQKNGGKILKLSLAE